MITRGIVGRLIRPFLLVLAVLWLGVIAMNTVVGPPRPLGGVPDRLTPCPATPNCVCTLDIDPSHAMPALSFTDAPEAALQRLRSVLAKTPRLTIVADGDDYIRAECRSFVFRFVDDVEFLLDRPNSKINFRSAARLGVSDLGVNRRRMTEITRAFEKAEANAQLR